MWFRSRFAARFARSTRPVQRIRPRLEVLEDRTLLSTYMVNALTDTGAGSGQTGDLRYCVTHATSGNDTITFARGLSGYLTLQSALPTLNANVAIQGPGAAQLAVSGGWGNFTIFTVGSAAKVAISGLTLTHGAIWGDSNDDATAISNAGTLTVSDSTISANFNEDNSASNPGKTIENTGTLTLSGCTLSDNSHGGGACIENDGSAAALTVSNTTISGNYETAIVNYGSATVGYSTLSGNNGSNGGAISNYGSLTVNRSTISGNKSFGGGPSYTGGAPSTSSAAAHLKPAGDGIGGGIYMGNGTLSINSSTLADNEAIGGSSGGYDLPGLAGNGYGGGLYIAGGTVTINNSTLAGNLASGGSGYYPGSGYGGGIDNSVGAGALQRHDTILADNSADTADPDLDGSVTSQGHNLIGNTSGGSGFVASDLQNVNPQLGPLQNNGGPTQTMALLAGSPAINAGDNTNAPAYDQRGPGFPRIVGGTIDIGSFEVQNSTSKQASSLTVTGFPSVLTAGSAGNFTVTAKNANGSTDTGYTGTVHFTSSDGQAVLPANYTFTAADAGVHVFSATLKTAGTQSIMATDTTTASLRGTESGITVKPAKASKLILPAPSRVTAGATVSLTVIAEDAYGNVAIDYRGAIRFYFPHTKGTPSARYTFTASDNGVHTFTGLVLYKKGHQKITVTDTSNSSLTASAIVDVL